MPQKHTKSNLYIEKTTTYDVLCKLGLLEFCLKPDRLLAGVFISAIIAFITTLLVLRAENRLQDEKKKLQKALAEIKTLRGIIPICSHCKQIRDDEGFWKQMEEYIHAHSEAQFSHGICPECMKKQYPEEYESIYPDKDKE